jgi:hypothetical protein
MPAGSPQELLDSRVADTQLAGNFRQRTPLDRPEHEGSPLAGA